MWNLVFLACCVPALAFSVPETSVNGIEQPPNGDSSYMTCEEALDAWDRAKEPHQLSLPDEWRSEEEPYEELLAPTLTLEQCSKRAGKEKVPGRKVAADGRDTEEEEVVFGVEALIQKFKSPKDFVERWSEQERLFEGLPRPFSPEQRRVLNTLYYRFVAAGRLLRELGREEFLQRFGQNTVTKMRTAAVAEEDRRKTEDVNYAKRENTPGMLMVARPRTPKDFTERWPIQKRFAQSLPPLLTPEQRRMLNSVYYPFVSAGKLLEEFGRDAFLQRFGQGSVKNMLEATTMEIKQRKGAGGGPQMIANVRHAKSKRLSADMGFVRPKTPKDFVKRWSEQKCLFEALSVPRTAEQTRVLKNAYYPFAAAGWLLEELGEEVFLQRFGRSNMLDMQKATVAEMRQRKAAGKWNGRVERASATAGSPMLRNGVAPKPTAKSPIEVRKSKSRTVMRASIHKDSMINFGAMQYTGDAILDQAKHSAERRPGKKQEILEWTQTRGLHASASASAPVSSVQDIGRVLSEASRLMDMEGAFAGWDQRGESHCQANKEDKRLALALGPAQVHEGNTRGQPEEDEARTVRDATGEPHSSVDLQGTASTPTNSTSDAESPLSDLSSYLTLDRLLAEWDQMEASHRSSPTYKGLDEEETNQWIASISEPEQCYERMGEDSATRRPEEDQAMPRQNHADIGSALEVSHRVDVEWGQMETPHQSLSHCGWRSDEEDDERLALTLAMEQRLERVDEGSIVRQSVEEQSVAMWCQTGELHFAKDHLHTLSIPEADVSDIESPIIGPLQCTTFEGFIAECDRMEELRQSSCPYEWPNKRVASLWITPASTLEHSYEWLNMSSIARQSRNGQATANNQTRELGPPASLDACSAPAVSVPNVRHALNEAPHHVNVELKQMEEPPYANAELNQMEESHCASVELDQMEKPHQPSLSCEHQDKESYQSECDRVEEPHQLPLSCEHQDKESYQSECDRVEEPHQLPLSCERQNNARNQDNPDKMEKQYSDQADGGQMVVLDQEKGPCLTDGSRQVPLINTLTECKQQDCEGMDQAVTPMSALERNPGQTNKDIIRTRAKVDQTRELHSSDDSNRVAFADKVSVLDTEYEFAEIPYGTIVERDQTEGSHYLASFAPAEETLGIVPFTRPESPADFVKRWPEQKRLFRSLPNARSLEQERTLHRAYYPFVAAGQLLDELGERAFLQKFGKSTVKRMQRATTAEIQQREMADRDQKIADDARKENVSTMEFVWPKTPKEFVERWPEQRRLYESFSHPRTPEQNCILNKAYYPLAAAGRLLEELGEKNFLRKYGKGSMTQMRYRTVVDSQQRKAGERKKRQIADDTAEKIVDFVEFVRPDSPEDFVKCWSRQKQLFESLPYPRTPGQKHALRKAYNPFAAAGQLLEELGEEKFLQKYKKNTVTQMRNDAIAEVRRRKVVEKNGEQVAKKPNKGRDRESGAFIGSRNPIMHDVHREADVEEEPKKFDGLPNDSLQLEGHTISGRTVNFEAASPVTRPAAASIIGREDILGSTTFVGPKTPEDFVRHWPEQKLYFQRLPYRRSSGLTQMLACTYYQFVAAERLLEELGEEVFLKRFGGDTVEKMQRDTMIEFKQGKPMRRDVGMFVQDEAKWLHAPVGNCVSPAMITNVPDIRQGADSVLRYRDLEPGQAERAHWPSPVCERQHSNEATSEPICILTSRCYPGLISDDESTVDLEIKVPDQTGDTHPADESCVFPVQNDECLLVGGLPDVTANESLVEQSQVEEARQTFPLCGQEYGGETGLEPASILPLEQCSEQVEGSGTTEDLGVTTPEQTKAPHSPDNFGASFASATNAPDIELDQFGELQQSSLLHEQQVEKEAHQEPNPILAAEQDLEQSVMEQPDEAQGAADIESQTGKSQIAESSNTASGPTISEFDSEPQPIDALHDVEGMHHSSGPCEWQFGGEQIIVGMWHTMEEAILAFVESVLPKSPKDFARYWLEQTLIFENLPRPLTPMQFRTFQFVYYPFLAAGQLLKELGEEAFLRKFGQGTVADMQRATMGEIQQRETAEKERGVAESAERGEKEDTRANEFVRFKSPRDFVKQWPEQRRVYEGLPHPLTLEQRRILKTVYYPFVAAGQLLQELGEEEFLQRFGNGTITQMHKAARVEVKQKKKATRNGDRGSVAKGLVRAQGGSQGHSTAKSPNGGNMIGRKSTSGREKTAKLGRRKGKGTGKELDSDESFEEFYSAKGVIRSRKANPRAAAGVGSETTSQARGRRASSTAIVKDSDAIGARQLRSRTIQHTPILKGTKKSLSKVNYAKVAAPYQTGRPHPDESLASVADLVDNVLDIMHAPDEVPHCVGSKKNLAGPTQIKESQQPSLEGHDDERESQGFASISAAERAGSDNTLKWSDGKKGAADFDATAGEVAQAAVAFVRPKSPEDFVEQWPRQKRLFESLPRPISAEYRQKLQCTYYKFMAAGQLLEELGEEEFLQRFGKGSVTRMQRDTKSEVKQRKEAAKSQEVTEDAVAMEIENLGTGTFVKFKSPKAFVKLWPRQRSIFEKFPRYHRTLEQECILRKLYYPFVAAGRLLEELGEEAFLQKFGKTSVRYMKESTMAESKRRKAVAMDQKTTGNTGCAVQGGVSKFVSFAIFESPKDFVRRWPEQKRLFKSLPHPLTSKQTLVLKSTFYRFTTAGRLLEELGKGEFLQEFGQGTVTDMLRKVAVVNKQRKAVGGSGKRQSTKKLTKAKDQSQARGNK